MNALKNVKFIQGDITKKETADKIINAMKNRKADLVVCDGAPSSSGTFNLTYNLHNSLLNAATYIAAYILKKNGNFISKVFIDDSIPRKEMIMNKMEVLFE